MNAEGDDRPDRRRSQGQGAEKRALTRRYNHLFIVWGDSRTGSK
jgi:hypothetical protein